MIGKTHAHYEIIAQIGKGGMGEVYHAKDTKLGRDIAIKVLPTEFAQDPDRVARFQREAKLLAALNHPNIAAIYGLEEFGGTNFIVLELVEGETLAERLKRGPIPVEESLKLALQIAGALEAAHEKGVIHRDLKPANIKITPEDKVKVLDFGLAKAFAGEQAEMVLSDSPTLSVAATRQGIILGTAAYMSPEQARGKAVDKRADIWAFGVVLYEMLTGKALFAGEDVTSTLARVLERQPDYSTLTHSLHPRILFLLERCLEKEAKNRYSSISDARVDIQKVLSDPGDVFSQPSAVSEHQKRMGMVLPWIAAVILIGVIVGMTIWEQNPIPKPQVMRLEYELPEAQQFVDLGVKAIAISPDGTLIAYSTPQGIYRRSIDNWAAELLEKTEDATDLFFSPDGRWIGFRAPDNKLKKIAVSGGAPEQLANMDYSFGISWTEDGRILSGGGNAIQWIPDEGGEWQELFSEEKSILASPQLLPDGVTVLYKKRSGSHNKIKVNSHKKGMSRELFEGDYARYIETGHIVYGWENNLYVVPFDIDELKVTGNPKVLVEGILNSVLSYQYDFSDSGTLVYIPLNGNSTDQYTDALEPVWVNFQGETESLSIQPDLYNLLNISPDGSQVAFTVGAATDAEIWIYDFLRKSRRPLMPGSFSAAPVWTNDGKTLAFMSGNGMQGKISLKAANGSGKAELIGSGFGEGVITSIPSSWSKDGRTLLCMMFGSIDGSASYDIVMVSVEGDGSYRPLLQEQYIETEPKISPDGRWMAYTSNESGQPEIYVRSYPIVEGGDRFKVSTNGGNSPLWSPSSRIIYYRHEKSVMAVNLITAPALKIETPKELFQGAYFPQSYNIMPITMNSWDIDPAGDRFLMLKPYGEGSYVGERSRKIKIVTNWFEELKKKVPVD